MPYDRQYAASPNDVLRALESAVRGLEKWRGTDPASRVIDFGTKTSGWSWGSHWKIQVQPLGSGGSLAVANIVSAGSMVAETSEGKKIRRIFDVAEAKLPKAAPPALSGGEPVAAVAARAMVGPDLSPKHEPLIGPILQALAEAEAAAEAGDVVNEELAVGRAQRTAASAGMLAIKPRVWCEEEIRARVVAGRLRKDVELLGKVGANLLLMNDRVLQGGTVRVLDDRVSASVEVGGQVLQSTRPTMTRMAVGSVLPGSALLVGLATPKTKTTDLRTASFILVHPEWRIVEPIDPDGAKAVSGLAAQINAIAAQRRAASATTPTAASPVTSVADELGKLAALREAGVLTDAEFATAKARLLT
jgi:hypothetical protein